MNFHEPCHKQTDSPNLITWYFSAALLSAEKASGSGLKLILAAPSSLQLIEMECDFHCELHAFLFEISNYSTLMWRIKCWFTTEYCKQGAEVMLSLLQRILEKISLDLWRGSFLLPGEWNSGKGLSFCHYNMLKMVERLWPCVQKYFLTQSRVVELQPESGSFPGREEGNQPSTCVFFCSVAHQMEQLKVQQRVFLSTLLW